MEWYVWGAVGGLLLPWLVFTKTLVRSFARGHRNGLETWLGMSWFSVPLMLGTAFVVHLVMDK
jgi:hypothetical protein